MKRNVCVPISMHYWVFIFIYYITLVSHGTSVKIFYIMSGAGQFSMNFLFLYNR